MKRLLFLVSLFFVFGQIVNGKANPGAVPGSLVVSLIRQHEGLNIDVSKDTQNIGNATANKIDFNTSETQSSNNNITAYEFWFDNNYASRIFQNIIPQQTYLLNTGFHTDGLTTGLHALHIRFKDNLNRWSSVSSMFFYKQSLTSSGSRKIIAYEYWFDNGFSSKVLQSITPNSNYQLVTNLITGNLAQGLHSVHIRFKDNSNSWSSVNSMFFYKTEINSGTVNLITAYRYWFDMAGNNMVIVNLPSPVNPYILNTSIETQGLSPGNHTLNFQFKDTFRRWSSVISDSFNINLNFASAKIKMLKNGPSENVYSIPENGTGYVYFSMVDAAGQPVADTSSFKVSLSDQANRKYQATGLFIKPGVLRIAIPGSQLTSADGASNTITIQDSIQIGGTLYKLSSTPPTFNIEKVQPDYTRTFDFFAEGSAGVSVSVGSIGLGVSIALAKVSISGTAGAGLTVSVNPDNELTLSRRLVYGVSASLQIPSVNFPIGKPKPYAGITAGVSAKTMISQEMTTEGISNLSSDQAMMVQAGFVLETLSMGIGNFSPTLGVLLLATQKTLIASSGISQTMEQSLIKESWGLDLEGTFGAGFRANSGVFNLNVGNISFSGELSGRNNTYPKGLPRIGNVSSSHSFTQTFNFNLSLLNFSFESDGVSASDSDLSFFDAGTGMDAGAEAFFDNNQQLQQINLWVEGGGNLQINASSPKKFIKTELDIPGEYQNILMQKNFAINGLFSKNSTITFKNLAQDFPAIVNVVTNNFIQTPITIKTYENTGKGTDLFLGADLDGAVGVGLGLKLGVDLKYYDEVSYLQKRGLIYGNNNVYLMSSANYSNQMDSYRLSTFFNTIIEGSADLVKTSFLSLMTSLKKVVASGENFIMNGINKAGNFVGSVAGNIQKGGQWFVSIFSPKYKHLWGKSFAEPVVQNLYYSTRIQHKETFNNKSALVNVATTMVAVSDNMKISFIPDGQTVSVDSIDSPITIKMMIDTAQLRLNGFTLADSSRIKIYRYNDANGNWIMVGGTLHGDTLEAQVKYMENYLLGIELTDADDKTAPTIVDYGPKQDSTSTSYPMIYAKIRDNQYGVGVNWDKTFLIANGDTLNASFDPTNQEIFYDLSEKDSLAGKINIKVWTEDYNGNSDSVNFSFDLTITEINEQSIGNSFKLFQNYPNPFSSTTRIKYSIAKESNVKILIFNSTGGYITTLIEKRQAAGSYSIDFDGSELPRGIYFYSLIAIPNDGSAAFRETRKMSVLSNY